MKSKFQCIVVIILMVMFMPVQAKNYLFISFTDPGNSGFSYLLSHDGYVWHALQGGEKIIKPESPKATMRDPFLIKGPDNIYHCLWTAGGKLGHATSKNLIDWSVQSTFKPFGNDTLVLNVWAPEMFYDYDKKCWTIFWSSTIKGLFPETAGQVENEKNHRIFSCHTTDFKSFTKPEIFYNPGFPVIDATLFKTNRRWIMVIKDERRWPMHKQLRFTMSASPYGPWKALSDTITPTWTEGPTVLKIDNGYLIYFDSYSNPQHMGALFTRNFKSFTNVTEKLSIDITAKHGGFIEISDKEAALLRSRFK